MEEIEIPIGAIAFIEGVFYKINENSRVFRWVDGVWKTAPRTYQEIKSHIDRHPNILTSIQDITLEWIEHYHYKGK